MFAVLTNNVHHFIFAFDFADPDWGGNYRYAFGYYVLVAWYIVLFVIFFATLFLSARKSLRSMLFPIGRYRGRWCCLRCNVYAPPCCDADIERRAYLLHFGHGGHRTHARFGLLPVVCVVYPGVSKLPFDLKVLEANGDTVFQTEMAQLCPKLRRTP